MESRINIPEVDPEAMAVLFGLENYLGPMGLDPLLKELIKIRVSQINGCAYCVRTHTETARKLGETEQRIYALPAWRESPLFSVTDRAILALSEEVTLNSDEGLRAETYDTALKRLGPSKMAQCLTQIVTTNTWNRIAISTQVRHE